VCIKDQRNTRVIVIRNLAYTAIIVSDSPAVSGGLAATADYCVSRIVCWRQSPTGTCLLYCYVYRLWLLQAPAAAACPLVVRRSYKTIVQQTCTLSYHYVGVFSNRTRPVFRSTLYLNVQSLAWMPGTHPLHYYRAMLAQRAVMRLLSSVRPSVCRSVTFRYRVQIHWNSSKIISRPNSLRPMCWLTPNIGDLVQREHPQN